ncbi:MAG: hypothetical protein IJV37_03485 [Bacteroidales bacterium]|nr:hypothetical protein [Bacteroidales bacterium]
MFAAILVVLLASCAPDRVAATLDSVESYINDRPDSALAVLRALDSTDVRRRALRARASLLHSMALDKCYIDLQTDSVLAPAIAWYGRRGSPDEKLKTKYYQGRLQYNAGDYQEAIVTYTEALALTDRATDYKYIGFVNQAIADTYAASFQESESFPYLDRAYEAFLQIPDLRLAKLTLYKKANALSDQRRWLDADEIYQNLLDHPQGIEPFLAEIKADYALHLVRLDLGNSAKSVELFNEVIDQEGSLYTANHGGAYAFCLFRIGEKRQSENIFRQLTERYPLNKQVLFWKSLAEQDSGQYREALNDYEEVMAYQDSVVRIQLNHSILAAQTKFFENRELVARQLAQRRVFWLWTVILLSCLLTGAGVVLYLRRIRRSQHENAWLQQVVDTVRGQIASADEEQTALRRHFSLLFQDYFSTLGKVCADYEEGKIDDRNASDRAVLRRLDRIIWDFTGKGGDHKEFERLLDKHLDNIMSDFRRDFPKMREQAYYLVGYVFAGLDIPTISVLMGVDADALYARKYRLKTEIARSSAPGRGRYLELFR